MKPTLFTIFTSVYNRKHTIDRVWDSLINQTNKNFEWIIINNESVDGIEPVLDDFKSKADFPVTIIHQENLGKFRAFDRAVDLAKGELFIPADSDDSFEYNTLERFSQIWSKYKADDISGITCLCKDEDGEIVGDKFPFDEGASDIIEINYKHKVQGEKWGCVRVDLLKKFRFPKSYKVTYFPDSYVWDQIGFNYRTVFINEPLRLYYQDAGNQVTNTKVRKFSKEVMRMQNFFTIWRINYVFPKVKKYLSIKEYFRLFIFMWQTSFHGGVPVGQVFKSLESAKSKFVALILYIPSFLFKNRWKKARFS